MTELCEVVITAPDPGWLKDFSRKLVEQRLCASAHNFAPIRSIYRWRGEIYERTEGRVSLQTRGDRVAEIVALAKQEHPYELPGVSTRTITGGNPDYLEWIMHETSPDSPTEKRRKKRTEARRPPPQRAGPPLSREGRYAPEPLKDTHANEGAGASAPPDTTEGGVSNDGKRRGKMPSRVRERSIPEESEGIGERRPRPAPGGPHGRD